MKHKWSEKTCSDDGHSSRKACKRDGCEIVCVTRHETDERGFALHWPEWFRGTELVRRGGRTPGCEGVEVSADG
ncbi:cytochrome C [Bradyrhizobium ottawaense]|uniref:cytochrome C n=1 Tax=Bradyrhizobium ottawaense TaxID=931866 RepID=UPI002714C280|nr:cytochrome C [Bradyrhizobium ottawaense]WLB43037.1 cytochrome C [Bradyrhizobium ottawaense]